MLPPLSEASQSRSEEDAVIDPVPPTPPPISIPSILFSQSLRLFCLRSILVAGSLTLAHEVYFYFIPGIVILSVTVLHHLLSAFGPSQFVPLFGWIDILLILAELSYNCWSLRAYTTANINYRWKPGRYVLGVFITWVLVIMLGALLSVKIVQLIDARGKPITDRVDILRNRLNGACGELERPKGWKYPVQVLLGKTLWERKFPDEPFWIAVFRGLLSLLVISGIVIFGIFAIVLEPVSEMGAVPTRELRAYSLDGTLETSTPITWNVVLVWPYHRTATKHLRETVSVTPLWDQYDKSKNPPCSLMDPDYYYQDKTPTDLGSTGVSDAVPERTHEAVIFNCSSRGDITYQEFSDPYGFFRTKVLFRPDLKLTVNFTELLGRAHQPGDYGVTFDSLKVYLALTNNTDDAIFSTSTTLLFPGTNLVGVADFIVRRRLKVAQLSTLGLFDIYNTFLIARMAYTTPDPLAAVIPDYPTGPNISTFRIVSTALSGEWTIIQDYRTKSIMGGFAEVGGLGTFLSIIFVILFGNSLLGIVYRTRLLTPFGLVHHLDTPRERLFKSFKSELGNVSEEQKRQMLLKFVFDFVIDLDIIAEEPPTLGRKGVDIEQCNDKPVVAQAEGHAGNCKEADGGEQK